MTSAPDPPPPGPPALHHIVYRSEAVPPVTARDLEDLLTVSRRNNRRVSVTGLLIFAADRYTQCLEGPPAAVHEIYDRIRADPRHRRVTTLLDAPVAARSFRCWDMACAGISASWWLELARVEWEAQAALPALAPSRGLMLMQSAWCEFGERFEGSLH